MNIASRLKKVLSFSNLSVRGFAIKCGISQKTLDNQIKGLRGISLDTIMSVLGVFPEVSAEWMMRGTGDMLIMEEDNSAELLRTNKLVDAIATLQEAINAKSETINALNERIKQLELQLNTK